MTKLTTYTSSFLSLQLLENKVKIILSKTFQMCNAAFHFLDLGKPLYLINFSRIELKFLAGFMCCVILVYGIVRIIIMQNKFFVWVRY